MEYLTQKLLDVGGVEYHILEVGVVNMFVGIVINAGSQFTHLYIIQTLVHDYCDSLPILPLINYEIINCSIDKETIMEEIQYHALTRPLGFYLNVCNA